MSLEKYIETEASDDRQPDEVSHIPMKITGTSFTELECAFCMSAINDGEMLELYQMEDGRRPLHIECKEAYEEQQDRIKNKEDMHLLRQNLSERIASASAYLDARKPTLFSLKRTAYLLACSVIPGFTLYSTKHIWKECNQAQNKAFPNFAAFQDYKVFSLVENMFGEALRTSSLLGIVFQTDQHLDPLIFIFGAAATGIAVMNYYRTKYITAALEEHLNFMKKCFVSFDDSR